MAYYFDGIGGSGDVTGGSASTDGEVVVYDGVGGKTIKRSNTLTGIATMTAGVLGVCSNLDDVAYEATANKGVANGYAPLDSDSLVPTENLPAGLPSEAAWSEITGKPHKSLTDYAGATGLDKLDAALTAIGSDPVLLLIDANITLTADRTIPVNITLVPTRGFKITINSTFTLTINGGIQDCLYQIFDDDSADLTKGVKFGAYSPVPFIRPEWWGAVSTYGSDNALPINQTLASGVGWNKKPVVLSSLYFCQSKIILNNGNVITSQGTNGAVSADSPAGLRRPDGINDYLIEGNNVFSCDIGNIYIQAGTGNAHVIYFHGSTGNTNNRLHDIVFYTPTVPDAYFSMYLDVTDIYVWNISGAVHNGIYFGGGDNEIAHDINLGGDLRGTGIKATLLMGLDNSYIQNFNMCVDAIQGNPYRITNCRFDISAIGVNSGQDYMVSESTVVPGSPYTATLSVPSGCTFGKVYAVSVNGEWATGTRLVRTTGSPATGQYKDNDDGTITFNSAQSGNTYIINYMVTDPTRDASSNNMVIKNNRCSVLMVGINLGTGTHDIGSNHFDSLPLEGINAAILTKGGGSIHDNDIASTIENNIVASGIIIPECKNNYGIDLHNREGVLLTSRNITGDYQSVYTSNIWHAVNATATNLYSLTPAAEGHEIYLTLDENTTLQGWNTNAKIYRLTGSTFTDQTAGTAFTLFAGGPAAGDTLYFGNSHFINGLKFNIGTAVAATSVTWDWQYGCTTFSGDYGFVGTVANIPVWQAETTYHGSKFASVVKRTTGQKTVVYMAHGAGNVTSGSTEPDWDSLYNGQFGAGQYLTDGTVSWQTVLPMQVINGNAFLSTGVQQVQLLIPNYSMNHALDCTNADELGNSFPDSSNRYWVRCRVLSVSEASNGGANQTDTVKQSNIYLFTASLSPLSSTRLMCINGAWKEI